MTTSSTRSCYASRIPSPQLGAGRLAVNSELTNRKESNVVVRPEKCEIVDVQDERLWSEISASSKQIIS